MSDLALMAIQAAHMASLAPSWLRFMKATMSPGETQREVLLSILSRNAGTEYGRKHGFDQIRSVDEYRSKVPIVDYDAVEPWIRRVAEGREGVLTAEPVLMFERSSGGAAAAKLIPYTAGLLNEFSAATGPWLSNLFATHPSLLGTRSYWSVSPVARERASTNGGIPVGFDDDSEYFGPIQRWAIRRTMAVDPSVARIGDVDAWRFETARLLLETADLGLISVWSPTFLTGIMRYIESSLDDLFGSLSDEARARVGGVLDGDGVFTGEALWPRLVLVSAWSDGASASFLEGLRRYFPRTPIQPKGLMATEGVVSFPVDGHRGSVLALCGHFLEFIEVDGEGRVLSATELRQGCEYSPVITTSGGLYRYHLKDVVRCVGAFNRVPAIRFVSKADRACDLVGEKVDARQVSAALDSAAGKLGLAWDFAMLAPRVGEPPEYVLYIESPADDGALARCAEFVEQGLAGAYHYRYARDIGQLGPVVFRRVSDGWETYEKAMVERGLRAGDVKPACLDPGSDWDEVFG